MRESATLDVGRISAQFEARAVAACPDQEALASRLIEHLQPPRWTLEWYLPWWLGQSVGIEPEISREIVLSNVLGLGSLRLRDDLADGDIGSPDEAGARSLSDALYGEAVAIYRGLLPPASPFWPLLTTSMSTWDSATRAHASDASRVAGTEKRARRFDIIARRGAPLKLCAHALCLLADRTEIVPKLDSALDHALAAWVLFDDANDWEADLAAGRWNAFVASVARAPQVPSLREANRAAVLIALLATDALGRYFARIRREAEGAAAIADELCLRPLSAHLRLFAEGTAERGAQRENHYHTLTERATFLLFGDRVG